MQDHYVEAHTSGGSTLLLMRLRDAAAELGEAGLQVHRSWWVAHDAVEAIEQEERRTLLRLRGGRRVPVSRASLPEVRAAFAARAGA
jgi:DNA-binding LytR/AlgR family response regulator